MNLIDFCDKMNSFFRVRCITTIKHLLFYTILMVTHFISINRPWQATFNSEKKNYIDFG